MMSFRHKYCMKRVAQREVTIPNVTIKNRLSLWHNYTQRNIKHQDALHTLHHKKHSKGFAS